MAASNHVKAIKDYLEDKGVDDLRLGAMTKSAEGGQAFILPTGGPSPQSFLDNSGKVHKQVACQIMVISPKHDQKAGYDKARSIYDHLTDAQPDGYLRVKMRQSDVVFAGTDDDDRAKWTVNVLAEVVE